MKAIKELGQHFLTDPAIASAIAELGEISAGDRVWEVGPGPGILSAELIRRGAKLEAFELDKRMADILKSRFGDAIDLTLIDILRLNWKEQISHGLFPLKIIANIPYQITSPLLYMIQEHNEDFNLVVLMVQKEVAQRLSASPGSKDFGPLTIKLGLAYCIHTEFMVGREFFDPVPKVDSAVIVMRRRTDTPVIKDRALFSKLLTSAFAHRRKTLRNNLLAVFGKNGTEELENRSGINFGRRAETLSEKEFIHLADLATDL